MDITQQENDQQQENAVIIPTRSVGGLDLIPTAPYRAADGMVSFKEVLVYPQELGDDGCMSIDMDKIDIKAGVSVERLIAAEARRVSKIYAALADELEELEEIEEV